MCAFMSAYFCTHHGRNASRERAQLRSKVNVNNDGRVRKSPTVQRIENDTTRCAMMTRRNDPATIIIPVEYIQRADRFIRDDYFERE